MDTDSGRKTVPEIFDEMEKYAPTHSMILLRKAFLQTFIALKLLTSSKNNANDDFELAEAFSETFLSREEIINIGSSNPNKIVQKDFTREDLCPTEAVEVDESEEAEHQNDAKVQNVKHRESGWKGARLKDQEEERDNVDEEDQEDEDQEEDDQDERDSDHNDDKSVNPMQI